MFCDLLAISVYIPFVLTSRLLIAIGCNEFVKKIPLNAYTNKSFRVIRNDSLDRFGTSLEQRFSKKEVIELMERAGLKNIKIGEGMPFYRAIGQK